MRSVTEDTITQAFMDTCAGTESARLELILERLSHHLHAFAKEVRLTPQEWQTGIELLYRAGKISSPERNEFILLSDVLGLSSLVDMVNSGERGTESSVLGPFHIADAPLLPVGADLIGANDGEAVVLAGHVRDPAGRPLAGALLDIWHTAANGLYSNQDQAQEPYNLRFRMETDTAGRYAFSTVRPAPYTVPDDGPVGDLLRASGRHAWRPAHFHFIVSAAGMAPLITELFPADDPYLDQDAVFGVRQSLILDLQPEADRGALPAELEARDQLPLPVLRADYDFTLAAAAKER